MVYSSAPPITGKTIIFCRIFEGNILSNVSYFAKLYNFAQGNIAEFPTVWNLDFRKTPIFRTMGVVGDHPCELEKVLCTPIVII